MMSNSRTTVFLVVGLLFGGLLAAELRADTGPPDPISLDRASPSVVDFFSTPGHIYDMLPVPPIPPIPPLGYDNAGPGPVVHIGEVSYGLAAGDNNDGHSNGEADPNQIQLSIYFSGDDLSVGLAGTDYDNQAIRGQAAGDRFMLNGVALASPAAVFASGVPSGVSPPILPGGLGNFPTNLLNANQHRYHEIPSIPPGAFNAYVPIGAATIMDDMDALELTAIDLDGSTTHTAPDTPIYFSLDGASPSLPGSPADIQVTAPGAGAFGLFAAAPALGLAAADDVDALAVWDVAGDLTAGPGDYALFSLAPGSPALGALFSPADIFVTDFSGSFTVYLTAASLGMAASDNIDALDVEFFFGGIQEPLDFVVPEPASCVLLVLGCVALGGLRGRRL